MDIRWTLDVLLHAAKAPPAANVNMDVTARILDHMFISKIVNECETLAWG
jgi:hypothetical protein